MSRAFFFPPFLHTLIGLLTLSSALALDTTTPAAQEFAQLYTGSGTPSTAAQLRYTNGSVSLERPWIVQARRESVQGGVTNILDSLDPMLLMPQPGPLEAQGNWTYQWAKSETGKDALLAFEPDSALVSAFVFDQPLERRALSSISSRSGTFYANDGEAYVGTPADVVRTYKGGVSAVRLGSVIRFENLAGVDAFRLYAATPATLPPLAVGPALTERQRAQRAIYQSRPGPVVVRQVPLGTLELCLNTPWLLSGTVMSSGGAPLFSASSPSHVLLPQDTGQQMIDGWTYVWARTDKGLDGLLAVHPQQALISIFVFDQPLEGKTLELALDKAGWLYSNDGNLYQGSLRDIALAYREGRTLIRAGAVGRFETLGALSALNLYRQGTPADPADPPSAPVAPPTTVSPPSAPSGGSSSGQCWVNGYTRKNGTRVAGYWRRC